MRLRTYIYVCTRAFRNPIRLSLWVWSRARRGEILTDFHLRDAPTYTHTYTRRFYKLGWLNVLARNFASTHTYSAAADVELHNKSSLLIPSLSLSRAAPHRIARVMHARVVQTVCGGGGVQGRNIANKNASFVGFIVEFFKFIYVLAINKSFFSVISSAC